MSLKKN